MVVAGPSRYWELDNTVLTVDSLIDCSSRQEVDTYNQEIEQKPIVRASLHFNVQSLQDFIDLVNSHTVISAEIYTETFYDVHSHVLMKNNIWMKRVVKESGAEYYSIKKGEPIDGNVVAYTEEQFDAMKEATIGYLIPMLKKAEVITKDCTTLDFVHEYSFRVSRYTLQPRDEAFDYQITIDNVHFKEQKVYTICAVKASCPQNILEEQLCETSETQVYYRICTVGAVLSKILFYLFTFERDLFVTSFQFVKNRSYETNGLQVFNMDQMYGFGADTFQYDDNYDYFGDDDKCDEYDEVYEQSDDYDTKRSLGKFGTEN